MKENMIKKEELNAELADLVRELSEMMPKYKSEFEAILTDPDSVDYAGLRERIFADIPSDDGVQEDE